MVTHRHNWGEDQIYIDDNDSVMKVFNTEEDSAIYFVGTTTGPTYPSMLGLKPYGAVELYYAGVKTAQTLIDGTGQGLRFYDADNQYGEVQKNSNGSFHLYNRELGGTVNLSGQDNGGAYRSILIGDPDGTTELYYTGLKVAETSPFGLNILDSNGDDPVLYFKSNTGSNLGNISFWGGGYCHIYDNVNSHYYITGNANGAVEMYYDGGKVLSTRWDGITIQRYDDTTHNLDILFDTVNWVITYDKHGAPLLIQGEDTGGTVRNLITADPDYSVSLYYNGTNVFSTTYTNSRYGFTFPATSNKVLTGTGSPESAVTANVGSMYLRTDGGSGTTLYIKESGTGNTGWIAK